MRKTLSIFFPIIFCALFFPAGDTNARKPDTAALREAVEASIKAEGKSVSDFRLIDQDGVEFGLRDYFKDGKPLVVSFIYTSCPDVCPAITAELKRAVDAARDRFGGRFNVLSVAFDPERDTPERLKEYGAHFTRDFGAFRFATAGAETIGKMTKEFGFFYARKDDGSFDHIDMVTVIGPGGAVYKQVYGIRTRASGVADRLDELITGKPAFGNSPRLVDRIKFFCYKYDPYTGRYEIDYAVIAGFFIQLFIFIAIIYAVWGKRIAGFFSGKKR